MILTNTPTLSYIYVKDLLITYNNQIYQIENTYTNKPYVYWYANDPYKLITSNTILEEKTGLFYIYFNNKGNYTQVPQDEIQLSFSDGESKDLITEKILGFQEQQGTNNERFTTIEVDIDGIKTSVGEINQDITNTKQTISEVNQKADSISLSVETLEKEYQYNEELQTIRNNTNIALLNLQSTLGLFNSDMNVYMEDNKMTDEESEEINTYKTNIEKEKTELNKQIDIVINLLESQSKTTEVNQLTSQKSSLNDAINNLITNVNTVCADKVFTNTEMISIANYFSKANTKINETNNMIDDFIFLESGGKLIQKISDLVIQQDEIRLGIKEETKILNEELSSIEERVQSAETKLTKDSITNMVKDTYYTKTEVNNKLNTLEDDVQDKIDENKTEIEKTNEKVASHTTSINSITSRVSETEKTVTSINGDISSIEERVESAESKLTKDSLTTTIGDYYATKSDIEGSIDLTGYAKTSEVKQTVDSLSAKFSESGGYNLIKNSTGANGTINGWTHNATSLGVGGNDNVSAGSRYYIYLDNGTTTSQKHAYSSRFKLRPNTTYRFTGYFCNYTKCPSFDVYVLASTTLNETDKTTSYDEAINLIAGKSTNGSWKKYTLTFTTPANVKSGYIRIDNNGYNSSGSNSNRVYWHCLILTKGELELPWSPHPSEVYDGITTIDKDGIKVAQSNYGGYTQMKADGFYVNNGKENVISITSDGSVFKGKVTIQSGSTVPTSTLDGTISSSQLNSTIISDISTAKTNSSTALNTANSVNTTVNNGKTNWNNAYNRVAEWAYGAITSSTTIDGGLIQTNTILSKHIAANAITANHIAANAITANMITTGTMSANRISGGTINGDNINVINLDASNITTGTLSGDRIKGGTISATDEINFVGGARIFGNAGSFGSGLTISAAGFNFSGGSINYLGGYWSCDDDFDVEGDLSVSGAASFNSIYADSTITTSSGMYASGTIEARRFEASGGVDCDSLNVDSNASIGGTMWVSTLYVNGTWVSSDKRLKTDIKYVDKDIQTMGESGLMSPNVNINKNDMLEFIEKLPIASYRYKDDVEKQKDITHYGLIVQDVLYTKVGSELVRVLDEEKQIGDENDYMGYSQEKLLVFMCGALQKEIELRKELEKRVEELENKK